MSELRAVPKYTYWPDQALTLSCGHVKMFGTAYFFTDPQTLVGLEVICSQCEKIGRQASPPRTSTILKATNVTLWP